MKVAQAEQHVLGSGGLQNTKAFTIRTSAHAFKMLSSGLYSDKVGAVLREIGCNAMDAHIDAGTPSLPFEVKLPNNIDRQFWIKDFGKGLSETEVMELYTTYFASTKQNTNDQTGAFGLGSKSPFSYTDSFVIESAHAGKRTIYSAHISNDGAPNISKMSEHPVTPDWEHGISISFPVKPGDITEFSTKADRTFGWFKVTPTVVGRTPIVPHELVHVVGDIWRDKNSNDASRIMVLMGNVAYPVTKGHLKLGSNDTDQLIDDLMDFRGLVLRMPIGAVQVAASREELQFDDATIAAIKEKMGDSCRPIAEAVIQEANKFDALNWADRCNALGKVHAKFSSYSFALATLLRRINITGGAEAADKLYARGDSAPDGLGTSDQLVRLITPLGRRGDTIVNYTTIRDGKRPSKEYSNDANVVIEYKENTVIIYGEAKFALPRVRAALIGGKYAQAIVMFGPNTKDEAEKLQKQMRGMPIVDVATLDIPAAFLDRKTASKTGRVARKKGQLPPLPVKDETRFYGLDKQEVTRSLHDIHHGSADNRYYVVAKSAGSWGNKRTEYFPYGDWKKGLAHAMGNLTSLWDSYADLSKALQHRGPKGFAIITPRDMRYRQLDKYGWKPLGPAIDGWRDSAEVIALVSGSAKKYVPVPTLNVFSHKYDMGLTSSLAWIRKFHPEAYDELRPQIEADEDLKSLMDRLAKAMASEKNAATPKVIEYFNKIGGRAPAYGSTTKELEDSLKSMYPVLDIAEPNILAQMVEAKHMQAAKKYLDILISRT